MTPADLRLFNPAGPDHVAVVSVEPAYARPGALLLRVARGARAGKLSKGSTYGPYTESELATARAELLATLAAEGFLPSGAHGALEALSADSAERRGRAAERLGWAAPPSAVDALLSLLSSAVDETPAVLDALGRLGDPRAIPAVRPYANRKLLSRRRSAVEAMRNLGDGEGLVQARDRTLAELPPAVRDALLPADALAPTPERVAPVVAAAKAAEAQRHGLIADLLYERGTPAAVAASAALIRDLPFDRPFVWRYVKSVLKRSMLRGDHATFGRLMHEVETRGRATVGMTATVKSGYDGVDRPTRIFGRRTQNYVRRAAWRHLRRLARYRPDTYAPAAAEALVHYTPDDAQPPDKRYGAFAACYLLHRILWGASPRHEFVGRSMKFRLRKGAKPTPPPGDVREEAFPALWDARPATYVRLLAAARLPEVQEFAHRGLQRGGNPLALLAAASVEDVLGMLDAPYEPTVQLAVAEIGRRFEGENPDWALVERLVADPRPFVREIGHRFLRASVAAWAHDPDRVAALLTSPDADTRALAAELAILWLQTDNSHHRALADRLLALLRQPEPSPGFYESLARVCRETLSDALGFRLTTDELLAWIANGSPAAQAVAGHLLGRRPQAVDALGLQGVTALAQHPLAAVRTAGQAMLRSAGEHWREDPSVLLALAESDWPDTRAVALDLLEGALDFARLGARALLGMLDSNREDVQNTAIDLARRHFAQLDAGELVDRLVEHPHVNMRAFALELVVRHLPDGPGPLAGVERFCRTILLDTWPQRRAKDDVIDFLADRGLRDEHQAAVAAHTLQEALRMEARCDFERALEALVRIRLAFPQVEAAAGAVGLPAALVGGEGA
jgi:HEAT repeat protein